MKKLLVSLFAIAVTLSILYAADVGPFYESSGPQNYKVSLTNSTDSFTIMRHQLRPWRILDVQITGGAVYVAYQTTSSPTNSATLPDGTRLTFRATDQFTGPIVMQRATTNTTTVSVIGVRE